LKLQAKEPKRPRFLKRERAHLKERQYPEPRQRDHLVSRDLIDETG
jgi:hypothetical protein